MSAFWNEHDPKFGNDLSFMTDDDWRRLVEERRKREEQWEAEKRRLREKESEVM